MLSQREWELEREWLKKILDVIDQQLVYCSDRAYRFKTKLLKTNKEMLENTSNVTGEDFELDADVIIDMNQYLRELKILNLNQEFYDNLVKRLSKMQQTPYFARLDFIEDGKAELEKLYIGLATLLDQQENCLIYDWRAPVSSMFYDFQPGRAEYQTKLGPVKGEICRKRQYKLLNGELQYMFDTDLKIDDDVLQEILAQSSSGKMKHIVTSIQKEQNRVIRDDDHQLLIVQGAAGSGKTSIALHRVAYLLYKYRNTIHSDNILIFSPNLIFSDYISNVLPELGETNMQQITFQEYAEEVLAPYRAHLQLEDIHTQYEYFLSPPVDKLTYQIRCNSAKYKSSDEFIQIMKNYIKLIIEEKIQFEDLICAGQVIVSREELTRIWNNSRYLPFEKVIGKIKRRFIYKLKPFKKNRFKTLFEGLGKMPGYTREQKVRLCMKNMRDEIRPAKTRLKELLSFDVLEMYLDLYRNSELFEIISQDSTVPENYSDICSITLESFATGVIPYEDITPLLYFKEVLEGSNTRRKGIKFVLIDEAQDYSPFQYEVISRIFQKSNLTLLGDLNQSIYSYMAIQDYRQIAQSLQIDNTKIVTLKNSYRSTSQITNFAKQILHYHSNPEITAVNRPGEEPEIIEIPDSTQINTYLQKGLETLRAKGDKSLAIICKTAAISQKIYDTLQNKLEINLITKDDYTFNRDMPVIIPSYLAKGLEFDGVIVYLDNTNNYIDEKEVNLLYTVCTRALHHLSIYHFGELSPLLNDIDHG